MRITLPARLRLHRTLPALALATAATVVLAGCGTSTTGTPAGSSAPATPTSPSMPGMDHSSMDPTGSPTDSGMDMADRPMGDGLSATLAGLRFAPATRSLPAGRPSTFRFRILGPDGKPVTRFQPDQTKPMHLYLVRSDLTGFQHVHPTMAGEGTWTASLTAAGPGSYRAYANFITTDTSGRRMLMVLGDTISVPGHAKTSPLPPPSTVTSVDGYTLTVSGRPMAGMDSELTLTVSRAGKPVTDLQPYLDTYAHLTAFHAGDLAFAHLHPQGAVTGDHGGPTLRFDAMLAKPGNHRLFVQFQTGGVLHTAAITVAVT